MQIYEIEKYSDIEKIQIKGKDKFIINLNNADIKERTKILFFFAGITFLNGRLKKEDKDNFLIEV